ncbi:MAG TPA: hypothetical protein VJN88_02545 [Ktedonobacterales bacterium]|nr:hypothetical protein [Ktedonobacterales bacterium]
MAKKFKPEPGQTIVYVQQKNNGCLVTALVFLLFGWLGLAVMACWKLTKLAWNWTITVGIKWPARLIKVSWVALIAMCVWSWKGTRAGTVWTVHQAQSLIARRNTPPAQ